MPWLLSRPAEQVEHMDQNSSTLEIVVRPSPHETCVQGVG